MLYVRTLTIYSIHNKISESLTFYAALLSPISVLSLFLFAFKKASVTLATAFLSPIKIFVVIVHFQEARTGISKGAYDTPNKLSLLFFFVSV